MKKNRLIVLSAFLLTSTLVGCKPTSETKLLVRFYKDAETVFKTVEVEKGKTVEKPSPDPEKEGCTFDRWYKDSATQGVAYDFSEPVNSDLNLYAGWTTNQYTVTFDADGGTPEPESVSVYHGNTVSKPTTDPVKACQTEGKKYVFKYWSNDSGLTAYDFTKPVTSNLTLKAYYDLTDIKYTVTFDADGGTPTPETQEVVHGGYATKPTTDPVKKHTDPKKQYSLKFWSIDEGKTEFNFTTTPITANTTIKAYYEETDIKYTITFKYNDGKTDDVVQQIVSGEKITGPETDPKGVEKSGEPGYIHNFEGWFDSEQNQFVKGTTTATKDITYTAKYAETKTLITYTATVVYDYDDTKETSSVQFNVENWATTQKAVIENLVPKATTDDTYTLREALPETSPTSDQTYYIDSTYWFYYDFRRPLETYHHLQFDDLSISGKNVKIIEGEDKNYLYFDMATTNADMHTLNAYGYLSEGSNVTIKYPLVTFKVKSYVGEGESMNNRTTFGMEGSDNIWFDSNDTWLRINNHGTSPATSTNTAYNDQYAETGIAFNKDDFNEYTYDLHANDATNGRSIFKLNGKRINATAKWTHDVAPTGKLSWGKRPGKNQNHLIYTFDYISVQKHVN